MAAMMVRKNMSRTKWRRVAFGGRKVSIILYCSIVWIRMNFVCHILLAVLYTMVWKQM